MSAATPTIQEAPGMRPLGAALVAVTLAVALLLALVASQQSASQVQVAPVAGNAPVVHDHGWIESSYTTRPAIRGRGFDKAHAPGAGSAVGGSIQYIGIPYLPPGQDGTGGANGTRFAR